MTGELPADACAVTSDQARRMARRAEALAIDPVVPLDYLAGVRDALVWALSGVAPTAEYAAIVNGTAAPSLSVIRKVAGDGDQGART